MTRDEQREQKRRLKSAARLFAVQALYQMEAAGQTMERVAREFEDHRFGMVVDDVEFSDADSVHFHVSLVPKSKKQITISIVVFVIRLKK